MLLWRRGIILLHDIHPKAAIAAPYLIHSTEGGGIKWVDRHTLAKSYNQHWRRLSQLGLKPVDAVLGDAALNNIRHHEMQQVLREIGYLLQPGGVAIYKQIVLPGKQTEFDVAELVRRHKTGALSDLEFRMALRFGCFHEHSYDPEQRVLDARRVFAEIQKCYETGQLNEHQWNMMYSTRSELRHTIYSIEEQTHLLERYGRVRIESASSLHHHRHLLRFFVTQAIFILANNNDHHLSPSPFASGINRSRWPSAGKR